MHMSNRCWSLLKNFFNKRLSMIDGLSSINMMNENGSSRFEKYTKSSSWSKTTTSSYSRWTSSNWCPTHHSIFAYDKSTIDHPSLHHIIAMFLDEISPNFLHKVGHVRSVEHQSICWASNQRSFFSIADIHK